MTGSPTLHLEEPIAEVPPVEVLPQEVPPAEEPAPTPAPTNTLLPSLTSARVEGQTVEGTQGSWTGSPTSVSYQWRDCDAGGSACQAIPAATASSHTLAAADVGHTLRLLVTASNAGGSASASSAETSLVEALPPPPPVNVTPPDVEGLSVEGQTLTASTGTWTGSPGSFSYQWRRCDALGLSCESIGGATSSTLGLSAADVGHTLQVLVTAENAGGVSVAATGLSLVVLGLPPLAPVNTVAPAITGTTVEGETVEASSGTWTGSPTSFAYEWQDCNSAGASCAPIAGADGPSYKLTSSDVGATLRVQVTATNAGGWTVAGSAHTGLVEATPLPAPVNLAPPTIEGSVVEGQTLEASTGTWTKSPTSYAYQWQDCNSSGVSCVSIPGATASSRTLTSGDAGDTIRVRVEATNAGGSTYATSPQTGVVQVLAPVNTSLPSISGSAVEGQSLKASNGSWRGSPTSFSYRWEDCNTLGEGCLPIVGATGSGYTLTAADLGDTIRVLVTAINSGGATPATSPASGTVAAAPPSPPVNTGLPTITGSAVEGQLLKGSSGSWSGNPTTLAYQWQDCNPGGSGCVSISGATGLSYTLIGTDKGHSVRLLVTASNSGGSTPASSAATNEVTAPSGGGSQELIGSKTIKRVGSSGDSKKGELTLIKYEAQHSGTLEELAYHTGYEPVEGERATSLKLLVYEYTTPTGQEGKPGIGNLLAEGTHTGIVTAAETTVKVAISPHLTLTAGHNYWLGFLPLGEDKPGSEGRITFYKERPERTGAIFYFLRGVSTPPSNGAASTWLEEGTTSSGVIKEVSGGVHDGPPIEIWGVGAEGSGGGSGSSPVNTVLPSITGSTVEGETVTAHAGSWLGSPTSFSYQWQDCDSSGAGCANVAGATSATHGLSASETARTVRVVVTATNSIGSTAASSPATGVIEAAAAPSAPANLSPPVISGSAMEGQTLSASSGSWSGNPMAYGYQWQDCNAAGASCSNVSGATAATHVLSPGEVGRTLRAVVVATNSVGSTAATSGASSEVRSFPSEGEETEAEAYEYRTEPRFLKAAGSNSCSQTVSSVAAAASAVDKAAGGEVICLKGGTYGAFALEGTHSSQVTLQPVPGESVTVEPSAGAGIKDGNAGDEAAILIRPGTTHVTIHGLRQTVKGTKGGNMVGIVIDSNACSGSYKVTGCGTATHGTNYIRLDHNDITGGYQGIELFSENMCYPHNPVWNGTVEAECAGAGKSSGIWGTIEHTIISGNHIHGFNGNNPEPQEDAFRASNFRYLRYTENEVNGVVQGKETSPPHSDGFQVFYGGEDLVWDHNYYHDNPADAMLLKDGDISNVALYDNLILRSQGEGETGIQIWCSFGVQMKRNTIWGGTTGLTRAGSASGCPQAPNNYELAAENNVLQQFSQYSGTEYFSHYPDTNNMVGKGAIFGRAWGGGAGDETNAAPNFACGSACGEGKDNYELTSNPKAAGVTWAPSERQYGP